jgi:hypothetical protein
VEKTSPHLNKKVSPAAALFGAAPNGLMPFANLCRLTNDFQGVAGFCAWETE